MIIALRHEARIAVDDRFDIGITESARRGGSTLEICGMMSVCSDPVVAATLKHRR